MAVDVSMNFSRFDGLGKPFGVETIVKTMERFRIEAAVLFSGMAVDADFRLGNKELLDAIKSDPRLYGCLVVNPAYPEQSIELMRSAMTNPKVVAMGIFRGASTTYPNADDCREIINAYRRFTKPIILHTPCADAVRAAAEIAREFPGIKFVLGAMGGADWRLTIPYAKQLNLLLDTSGSFDSEKIEMAVNAFGPHRVVYGSGFPFSDIPSMLALVQSSGIAKDALPRVLGDNAKALFGIGRPARQETVEE